MNDRPQGTRPGRHLDTLQPIGLGALVPGQQLTG
jgi:hypothetical protein